MKKIHIQIGILNRENVLATSKKFRYTTLSLTIKIDSTNISNGKPLTGKEKLTEETKRLLQNYYDIAIREDMNNAASFTHNFKNLVFKKLK